MANDIVSLFESILAKCKSENVSDLHIEPKAHEYQLRARINGSLMPFMTLSTENAKQLIRHIKLSGHKDIAETRKPQDGRIGESVRFSTILSLSGEKCVLRFLQDQNMIRRLDQCGFTNTQLNILKKSLHQSQGLIVVTGPTGSGKTSTIYSLLNSLDSTALSICTIEDPVECLFPNFNQFQVDERSGLPPEKILKHILRQDPDVILVGEIRDEAMAMLTLKAAQTGHLVFATLHTNSAVNCITRLKNFGCDKQALSECLSAVVGQRLIRTLNNGQFSSRRAIFEVLEIDQNASNHIAQEKPIMLKSTQTLKAHAEALLENGVTTAEEINRVCA